ncbi:unnamed protein product [Cylicostephanus goldi]|uniref:Uncharacterized protein n=1 Tax=Cylicostephanus goldi TaxID=71465 RepID=A0A3P6QW39_CYLGO|nr:unnamed protein product [Cylicostephanus goldi]
MFTIILFVIHLFCTIHAANKEVTRIDEMLTKDREFYDLWQHLITVQADQYAEQSIDFPLSYASLNSCTRVPPSDGEEVADSLRPSSVDIYADLGHLSTFCKSNLSMLQAGWRAGPTTSTLSI